MLKMSLASSAHAQHVSAAMDHREITRKPLRKAQAMVSKLPERRRVLQMDIQPALHAVLDHLSPAVMLICQESRLLFRNRGAQVLLNEPGALKLRAGKLWLADTLAASFATGQVTTSTLLQGRKSLPHSLCITHLGLRRQTDPIALIVFAPHRERRLSVPLLQQLYRLTHAEATTAAQLFAGKRPADVARALSVTTHTVRSHIKRIFSKCEVNSQVELVRLLALGAAALEPGFT